MFHNSGFRWPRRTIRCGIALCVAGGLATAGALVAAPPAFGATTTLHIFSKGTSFALFQANGQRVTNQNTQPAQGDYFVSTATDYSGTAKKHSSTPTGADNLVCTVISGTSATCDGVIAVGNSLLLANHVSVTFGQNGISSVTINAGTGHYKGSHGTVTSSSSGGSNSNNNELTVKVTT